MKTVTSMHTNYEIRGYLLGMKAYQSESSVTLTCRDEGETRGGKSYKMEAQYQQREGIPCTYESVI